MRHIVLIAKHLAKRFGKIKALEDVSFEVYEGEVYALVGPNGAGKTTTLKIICSLLKPDKGYVRVMGYDVVTHRKDAMKYMAFVPDAPVFYASLTVREQIELYCCLRGVNVEDVEDRLEYLLEAFGLRKYERVLISKLSRGNIQKLALVQALLLEPKLIVMDEPYNNIDVDSQIVLKEEIMKLAKKGSSFLISSHILPWVSRIADRVGFINHGRILEEGRLDDLLAKYGTESLEGLYKVVIRGSSC
ncbi:MAG: ABC transporter ATP-binding protein [Thermoprotei archaeon]|nr:MAG: ABC transporter ATP-binding protein [Thermoprotei archaeon]RLF24963.1 MAG: ABC transporter ATP-binding protein [Thermoprotei archaeon]